MEPQININEFTLGELEQLELLAGMTFEEISNNFNRPRVIKAVIWISAKRTNPNAKLEEFDKLTLAEATRLIVGEPDPKA
jgi:hypothetical protein